MSHVVCRIQWIDESGRPTPDENPAIGHVRREAYVEQYPTAVNGVIQYETTEWFPICAAHATQLRKQGMERWTFKPLPGGA